jgi:hypothetical protein
MASQFNWQKLCGRDKLLQQQDPAKHSHTSKDGPGTRYRCGGAAAVHQKLNKTKGKASGKEAFSVMLILGSMLIPILKTFPKIKGHMHSYRHWLGKVDRIIGILFKGWDPVRHHTDDAEGFFVTGRAAGQ